MSIRRLIAEVDVDGLNVGVGSSVGSLEVSYTIDDNADIPLVASVARCETRFGGSLRLWGSPRRWFPELPVGISYYVGQLAGDKDRGSKLFEEGAGQDTAPVPGRLRVDDADPDSELLFDDADRCHSVARLPVPRRLIPYLCSTGREDRRLTRTN